MKILFVNPPVIRSTNSSPENNFRVEGFVFGRTCRRIPGLVPALRAMGVGRGIRYGVRAGSRWPWTADTPLEALHYPFLMAYAAALLRGSGFQVGIIDAVADEQYSYGKFFRQVEREKADIVVVECSTPTIDIDLWVAGKISSFSTVALAGPHLETHAEKIRAEHPRIACLLKGEYIRSSLEMASTRRPGIYEAEVVDDLDAIPFPFRDYQAATRYYDPTMPTPRPQLQIYAGKGCPFHCTFCLWPQVMYHGKVALRRPDRVAEEIRQCVDRYGYRSIFFDDDTFNIGNDRIGRLCDELKQIGLPWTMMGRLDCSPPPLYEKMVDSGCVGMRFGIETFDSGVLKNIKKRLESEAVEETLAHITRKHPRLMIHLTMMKDLPGQTEEIHQNDMRILRRLGYSPRNIFRSYQLAACAPFPGTEMYKDLVEKTGPGALDDFSLYDGGRNTVMKRLGKG
jgi:radical SAM superfamily enzyme YgiQ (UPF0313 family)